ncbi:unnamed protein product [Symbiodinium microadriaticum]|nr:unnamed protein product [Symbiodinium microadriaticum]
MEGYMRHAFLTAADLLVADNRCGKALSKSAAARLERFSQVFPDSKIFDLSQNPNQRARLGTTQCPTLTKTSIIWNVDAGRGAELLMAHGLPLAEWAARAMGVDKWFGKECAKRWDMAPKQIQEFWLECQNDQSVPKGTDERGFPTIAKLVRHKVEAGREIKHERLTVGMDMAIDTGIFDYANVNFMSSSLPAGCLITPAGGNRASNGRSAASSSTAGKKRKLTEAEADGTNEEGNAKPKKKTVKLSDGAKARMDEMDRDRRKLRFVATLYSWMGSMVACVPMLADGAVKNTLDSWGARGCAPREVFKVDSVPSTQSIDAFDAHMKSKLQDLNVMHKKLSKMLSKQCPGDEEAAQAAAAEAQALKEKQVEAEANAPTVREQEASKANTASLDDVPAEVSGVPTHGCRCLATMLEELGDFRTESGDSCYKAMVEGSNVTLHFLESMEPFGEDEFSEPHIFMPLGSDDPDETDENTTVERTIETTSPVWLIEAVGQDIMTTSATSLQCTRFALADSPCASMAGHVFSFSEGSALGKHLQPLDYISQLAMKPEIASQFPQAKDVALLRSLGEVSCARFPADSVQVGPTDRMLGRVIHCCFGKRLYIAVPFEPLVESFAAQFQQDAKTIGQLASWLHKMPFDRVEEIGFFVMLVAGATLLVPPGCIVVECCLGEVGATVVSYPTLLPGQFPEWQQRWQQIEKMLNPDNASQVNLGIGMNFVHRMIMIASVKSEPEAEPEVDANGDDKKAAVEGATTATRAQAEMQKLPGTTGRDHGRGSEGATNATTESRVQVPEQLDFQLSPDGSMDFSVKLTPALLRSFFDSDNNRALHAKCLRIVTDKTAAIQAAGRLPVSAEYYPVTKDSCGRFFDQSAYRDRRQSAEAVYVPTHAPKQRIQGTTAKDICGFFNLKMHSSVSVGNVAAHKTTDAAAKAEALAMQAAPPPILIARRASAASFVSEKAAADDVSINATSKPAETESDRECDDPELENELEKTLRETYPDFVPSADPAPTTGKSTMPKALAFQKATPSASPGASSAVQPKGKAKAKAKAKAKSTTRAAPQNPWPGQVE